MNKKNQKNLYVFLYIAILMINALIIVAFRDRAAITICSIPAIVFAVCSVIGAIIAVLFREYRHLFFLNKFIWYVSAIFNREHDGSYNGTQTRENEINLPAFIYCASIPVYITVAFFADTPSASITFPIVVSLVTSLLVILSEILLSSAKHIVHRK